MRQIVISVITPAEILAGYGAGALIRIERDTSATFTTPTEFAVVPIVASATEYEYWDAIGTAAHYYRTRYSKAAPVLTTDYSDYGNVFVAQAGYTSLAKVRLMAKIATDTDEVFLLEMVDAANAWLRGELLGIFVGPSTDTSRTYDIPTSTASLFIPGGVRTVTSLQLRESTGGTLQTVNSTDYVLRPEEWLRLPGLVADRIDFLDSGITGSYNRFYRGTNTVTVIGSFGPATVPADLARIATTVAVWLYQSRQSGAGAVIGNIDTGELIVNRVLTPFDGRTIRRYRSATRSYAWI